MTTNSHPTSDREALSALFDGELTGDAARFALKRLDHDQAWRASCERWQVVGDALRRTSNAHMPSAFSERVRDALNAADVAKSNPARAPATNARRWSTVALAASAAIVAFFLARLPMGGEATTTAHAPVVAANTELAPARSVAAVDPAPRKPHLPNAPAEGGGDPSAAQFAGASVALATVASQRARTPQRTQRGGGTHGGVRAPANVQAIETVVADARPSVASPDVLAAVPAATPFDAQSARPWPRAVLPQYHGSAALSADYVQAPSFYPFVPRVPVEQAANDDAPALPGSNP